MEKVARFAGTFAGNMLTYTPAMLIGLFGNPWFAIAWAMMRSIQKTA